MMKKSFISKYLAKLTVLAAIVIFASQNICIAKNLRIISLAPDVTEIIYALHAEQNLVGVSTSCNYPKEAKSKKQVGDFRFVNKEEIIKLKPDYIFALSQTKPLLGGLNNSKIKIIYFDFENVNDIYVGIKKIGIILGKKGNADKLTSDIKMKNKIYKTAKPKKILYLVQTNPYITIGSKSYITELITLSGNQPVTANIPFSYPAVTGEFISTTKPDLIVLTFPSDIGTLKKLCPKSKIVFLNKANRDIINRPGLRIYKGIEYFSKL